MHFSDRPWAHGTAKGFHGAAMGVRGAATYHGAAIVRTVPVTVPVPNPYVTGAHLTLLP